jgi:phage host-nuclease inhibitor protein Gam
MSFFRRRRAILDSILRNLINIGLGAAGLMAEVGKETTKMRNEYNAKILNMGGRIDVLEFDIANLLERNAELHTELKSWTKTTS